MCWAEARLQVWEQKKREIMEGEGAERQFLILRHRCLMGERSVHFFLSGEMKHWVKQDRRNLRKKAVNFGVYKRLCKNMWGLEALKLCLLQIPLVGKVFSQPHFQKVNGKKQALLPSALPPRRGPSAARSRHVQNNGLRAVMRPFSMDWFVCRKKSSGAHCEKTRLLLTMALMKLLEGSDQGERTPSSRRRREREMKGYKPPNHAVSSVQWRGRGRHTSWMPSDGGWSIKLSL